VKYSPCYTRAIGKVCFQFCAGARYMQFLAIHHDAQTSLSNELNAAELTALARNG